MEQAYFCPNCRGNRTRFGVISQTIHEVQKDPVNGEILALTEEQPFVGMSGAAVRDVKCLSCGFVGQETMFISHAARYPRS